MPTLLATTTAFVDWARHFCVNSPNYNADGMARSSGAKQQHPSWSMFNKKGQNTGARACRRYGKIVWRKNSSTHRCRHVQQRRAKYRSEGVQKPLQHRHCEANRGKTKDNSKNVRTPDNKAAHVAADEDPRENGIPNKIATSGGAIRTVSNKVASDTETAKNLGPLVSMLS